MATDGIDFVDKDNARRILLCLLEEIAHAAGAHTHEHLDKLGTRDAKEGYARFARHSLGHERLTCARRAYQQHTLGDTRTQSSELLRLLEEFDYFLQFL